MQTNSEGQDEKVEQHSKKWKEWGEQHTWKRLEHSIKTGKEKLAKI